MSNMRFLCVFVIICIAVSESQTSREVQFPSPKVNTSSEQTGAKWSIKLDVDFSKNLPPTLKKPQGSDARLKCEAYINFTKVEKSTKGKEKLVTSLKESPPDHIVEILMKNVMIYWTKDDKNITDTQTTKITTKTDIANGTIGTFLKLKNVQKSDEGKYTCIIKHFSEKKQTTHLVVTEDSEGFEVPSFVSLFPESGTNNEETISENLTETERSIIIHPGLPIPETLPLNPLCQEYTGKTCADFLKGHFVYIPYGTTQLTLEEKLSVAVTVTRYSNEISSHCVGFALPSLCFSTFPICRDPISTNNYFLKEAKQMLEEQKDDDQIQSKQSNIQQQSVSDATKKSNVEVSIGERFNYRWNSSVLIRVCKQDCVILETELCQTEYAIAKRHPQIGKQLTLEECKDLPEEDPSCLKTGVGATVSDDECFWENGSRYLGQVSVADNGLPCLKWFQQFQVSVTLYPELAGRHAYCRNPGGIMSQPWCVVAKDNKQFKQLCDIPKCAHKIWIYIVIVFVLSTTTILGLIICIFYRNKNKNHANLSDMNLPSADKNIYGNSRLHSPIEMNDMLSNQNSHQPHLRPGRGNGVLKVPQYSLSQIKFLEELGEGAFGKVYKGALKSGNELLYVAVKALKENASAKTQSDFRREIDLISELRHDNIVCIVGVALKEEPLCMLFEFMARGDLHEFLMGRAPPSGKGLPAMRLLQISLNIASGMHYLASHHYVHRDLAARNCLVSDDFVVKISDFGLSRDIYSSDYYRVQSKSLLPVRWMPPESILYGKFTTESDIWSYGVVLWEIYSYGLQPYYGYSNQEVISMVRGGELLAAPAACPQPVYSLMRDCWRHQPNQRPKFDETIIRIQQWIDNGGCPISGGSASECGTTRLRSGSSRDLQERAPLLPAHFASSNGSLATGSLKKLSLPNSFRCEDTRSTCSEAPPLVAKKKHSSGSLIDERTNPRSTIVRMPSGQFGNEI